MGLQTSQAEHLHTFQQGRPCLGLVHDAEEGAVYAYSIGVGREIHSINASCSSFLRFPEPIIAPNTKATKLTKIITIISMSNLSMNNYLGRIYTKTYLVCAVTDKCRIKLIYFLREDQSYLF